MIFIIFSLVGIGPSAIFLDEIVKDIAEDSFQFPPFTYIAAKAVEVP
jgi:hypothetical protein